MAASSLQLSRGHRKKERTRRQLVDGALRVLAERGESFAVSDVAEAAGVSSGTFYNYFADREALLEALAADVLLALGEAAAREGIDDPAERFAVASASVLRQGVKDPTWGRAVLRLVHRPGVVGDIDRFLREDLSEGAERGRFAVGAEDAVVDQVVGLLVLTIRRIVEGVADARTPVLALERALRAIGVEDEESTSLARAAWERSAR